MIWPFKKKYAGADQVYAIYNLIVAQSRHEKFYAEMGVADTVTGRFDMICLHMCLVLRRLRKGSGGDSEFSQELFDLFFLDMDRSLREMGVGDVSVPKRIEKMGSLFYGLLDKLTAALDSGDEEAVAEVVGRNVFGDPIADGTKALAAYLKAQAAALEAQEPQAIEAGVLTWKDAA